MVLRVLQIGAAAVAAFYSTEVEDVGSGDGKVIDDNNLPYTFVFAAALFCGVMSAVAATLEVMGTTADSLHVDEAGLLVAALAAGAHGGLAVYFDDDADACSGDFEDDVCEPLAISGGVMLGAALLFFATLVNKLNSSKIVAEY